MDTGGTAALIRLTPRHQSSSSDVWNERKKERKKPGLLRGDQATTGQLGPTACHLRVIGFCPSGATQLGPRILRRNRSPPSGRSRPLDPDQVGAARRYF
ncbi:hypothetical protein AGIG_G13731 [Arapaima gigas]